MENGRQKEYTFLNMKRCQGRNGNPYIGLTLSALVCNPDLEATTTNTGKRVISFSTPIKNQGRYLETMCGMAPYESQDGTVWARVSLWDSDPQRGGLATRFQSLLSKTVGKTLVLLVTGSVKVEEQQGNNGRSYVNVNVTCDDFTVMRCFEAKNGSQQGQASPSNMGYSPSQQMPSYGGRQAAGGGKSGRGIPDGQSDYYTMDFEDGELPF